MAFPHESGSARILDVLDITRMQVHGSCACRGGAGVLLLGASGAGKSDLLLRLLREGFALVSDDRTELEDGVAMAPAAIAGLLEVRGLGLVRLPFVSRTLVRLAVLVGQSPERLPGPAGSIHGAPLIVVDPRPASAPLLVGLALDLVLGRVAAVAGALE